MEKGRLAKEYLEKRDMYKSSGGKSKLSESRKGSTNLEYLSSGENLAGCADLVTSPFRTFLRVYVRFPSLSRVYIRCILEGRC